MKIPELLDQAKKAQGFTTDMALAKALNVSRSAVSAWRNGVKTPDTVQCAALARFTGLPLARVLGIVDTTSTWADRGPDGAWLDACSCHRMATASHRSDYAGCCGGTR